MSYEFLIDTQQGSIGSAKSFIGVMPSYHTPIDIVGLHLLGRVLDDFHMLIADKFLEINGLPDSAANVSSARLSTNLNSLDMVYGECKRIYCSSFMEDSGSGYAKVLADLRGSLDEKTTAMLLDTVPEKHKFKGIEYPLNEVACVKYLSQLGFKVKIGPEKEKVYDKIISDLGIDMGFAYLRPCYALGTKSPESVVHYSPHSKGSGQRMFIADVITPKCAERKLALGPDEALRYFCRLGSLAASVLGNPHPDCKDIDSFFSRKKLKKMARQLMFDNVVDPIHSHINFAWRTQPTDEGKRELNDEAVMGSFQGRDLYEC